MTESELVANLSRALVKIGFTVSNEVPNMGQSVDIVATDRDSCLWLIEAKLRDWKRALSQCLAHEQVADFICIAIPFTLRVSDRFREEATARGYGVLGYNELNDRIAWIVSPTKNQAYWAPQRDCFTEQLRGLRNGDRSLDDVQHVR